MRTNREGTMKAVTRRLALAASVALSMVGCFGSSAFPPVTAPPPPEVTIAQPIVRETTDYDEFPGVLKAIATVDIKPRVSGYLTKLGFKDGDMVKEGQLLFEIDPRPYQADYDLELARIRDNEAKLKLAEVEAKRATGLLGRGATTREDYDEKVATLDESRASLDVAKASAAQAKLNLDWTQVTSPVAGRVSRRNIDIGNLVDSGPSNATSLTTVVSMDPIYTYFDIDERAAQRYRRIALETRGIKEPSKIAEAKIPVEIGLAGEAGFPRAGTLDFVDNRVSSSTGTVQVRAVIPNPDLTLVPGFFVRTRLRAGPPSRSLLVAERAIGIQQDRRFVLVVDRKTNRTEQREVSLGRLNEGLRAITAGLKEGEWIVVDGLLQVQPPNPVKPTEIPMPIPAAPAPLAPSASAPAPGKAQEAAKPGPAPAPAAPGPADAKAAPKS